MRNLKLILEDLNVKWTMPVQPVVMQEHYRGEHYLNRAEELGNAGRFRGGSSLRPPGRSFSGHDGGAEGGGA